MVSIAAMRARTMSPAVAQTNIGARRVARRHISTSAGWRRRFGASVAVVVSDIGGDLGIWSRLWPGVMDLSRNISYGLRVRRYSGRGLWLLFVTLAEGLGGYFRSAVACDC